MNKNNVTLLHSNKYYINLETNKVFTKYGKIVEIDKNNEFVLDWIFGIRKYRLDYVLLLSYVRPNYPLEVLKDVTVGNDDPSCIILKNLYLYFKKPIEHLLFKDMYYIPYFSNYLINKEGELYSIRRNIIKRYNRSKPAPGKNITGGYFVCSCVNDFNVNYGVSRHRLLAMVFLDSPGKFDKYVVNHLNGIPGDDRLENLEFITKRENNIHAIKNNLMPNSIVGVTAKNILTGYVKDFMSIAECCVELNIKQNYVRTRLLNNNKAYPDGWYFKKTNDTWPDVTSVAKEGVHRKVIGYNVITGVKTIANSIMGLSELLGVNTTSISDACKTNNFKPIKQYMFKYSTENNNFPILTNDVIKKIRNKYC